MENVIISYFKVESDAYQVFSNLKKPNTFVNQFTLSQVALFKKSKRRIIIEDGFDTGKRTLDYTLEGGLVGGLVGILSGPLGMLLGFGSGSVTRDTDQASDEVNLIFSMTSRMKEGDVAIVAVVHELSEKSYDIVLEQFDAEIVRYGASAILEEIEHGRNVEIKLQELAKKEMRKERSEHRKSKVEEYRTKFKGEFTELKKRFSAKN